jgi:uroporphyrinogen-III synthase
VLHVGAADPHPALGDGLARAGLKVTQTPVYRVVPFDEVDAPREPVHAMVFTSPNSVRAWAATHSGLATGAGSAIAIGPSTEQALREAGMPIGHALTTTGPSELVAAVRELLGA